jgi:hypothetical protein
MKSQWQKNTLNLFIVTIGLFFISGCNDSSSKTTPKDDIDDVYGTYSVSEIVGFKTRKEAKWIYERCEEIANHYYFITSYLLEEGQGMDEMTEYSNNHCDGKFVGFSELITTYKLEEIDEKTGGIQEGILTINAFGEDKVFKQPVSVNFKTKEVNIL